MTDAFADGGVPILTSLGVPTGIGAPFMTLVLSAFAPTTVDTSIRLGRYFLSDMIDVETSTTRATHAVTNEYLTGGAQALLTYLLVASGSWATVWPLFGAPDQIFAGLYRVAELADAARSEVGHGRLLDRTRAGRRPDPGRRDARRDRRGDHPTRLPPRQRPAGSDGRVSAVR